MPLPPPDVHRRHLLLRAAGALLVLSGLDARADESYPNRPIRLVPFGTAGGPIDSIARVYAEALKQRWSQPAIVDAKPGASEI